MSDELRSTNQSSPLSPHVSPIRQDSINEANGQDLRVRDVALACIKKVGIALAVNVAVIAFVAQPAFSVWVFTAGLGAVLVDALVNFIALRVLFSDQEVRLRRMEQLANLSHINNLSLMGPGILIHELGHYLAALACYRNAQPSIHIQCMRRGHTDIQMRSGLSRFGAMMGARTSLLLVMGAGFIMSTTWALIEFAVAYFTQESNPTLSEFLRCQGTCQLLNELSFGLVTLLGNPMALGNDYVTLQMLGGIHPLTAMVSMILAVAVEHLILAAIDDARLPSPDPQTPPPPPPNGEGWIRA